MLKKINFMCHAILPLVYEDSLSYYELLCKVVHKVNEIIDSNEELKNEMAGFYRDYETDVEQAVKVTLDRMVEDGTFDTIINRIVSKGVIPSETKNAFISSANYAPYEIYEVLKTYVDNTDKFYYEHNGGRGIVGYDYDATHNVFTPGDVLCKKVGGEYKYPIVCCELVELGMMGVPFERCRVNTGNTLAVNGDGVIAGKLTGGENVPYGGGSNINLASNACKKYWGNSGNGTLYSAELAEMLNDAGLLHRISYPSFVELSPGDILFYTIPEASDKWNGIGHVDVFLGWSGNNMIVITTDNNDESPAIRYQQNPATGTMASRLKWYARLPKPGNPHFSNNVTTYYGAYPRTINTNATASFILPFDPNFSVEPNRVYSCIIHATELGGGGYINVQGYNSNNATIVANSIGQIYMHNQAQNIAKNTYYCLFRTGESVDGLDSVRISVSGGTGVVNAVVHNVAIYDKLINPGFVGNTEHAVVKNSGTAPCLLLAATDDDYVHFTIKNGFISFNGTVKNRTDHVIPAGTSVFKISEFKNSLMAEATTSMYFYCGSRMYRYNHVTGDITLETDLPIGATDKICAVVPLMKLN